ncbi:MAG: aspartate--tRNA(Asn) ligase [Erysipelotrichaceae bacterium]|nr:aspartate--tRNA(Asn) ligase [Erysipelotrichaceae bacterium]
MRTKISELKENTETTISGLVEKVRNTKYMVFVIVQDTTGHIQVSIDKSKQEELANEVEGITVGSFVSFIGEMVLSEYVKDGGCEFLPSSFQLLSLADVSPIENNANVDTKMDYRWLDLRNKKNILIFQIQSYLVQVMREFLYQNNFTEIHTPKLIATASESGSEVFEVKYFDRTAYLAQSPQFYKQMAMASGFDRIFEVAPAFRAENSNTNRHTTEFTSFDLEFSYIESYKDVMYMEQEMLKYALAKIKEKYGEIILKEFGREVIVPVGDFPVIKLQDLYQELHERYGYEIPDADVGDLNAETESLASRYAMEVYNSEFLFVTDYSATKRAFYHMRDEFGIPQGYDLIWRGTEITTGAQREHRYELLKHQAHEKGLGEDVKFYLEFFKYGCPPHGGFAIGVDRLTMLLLDLPHLREAMFLFRSPNRLNP